MKCHPVLRYILKQNISSKIMMCLELPESVRSSVHYDMIR